MEEGDDVSSGKKEDDVARNLLAEEGEARNLKESLGAAKSPGGGSMMFGKENAEKLARQARGSKGIPDSHRRFLFCFFVLALAGIQ